jgi:hypothetical protein
MSSIEQITERTYKVLLRKAIAYSRHYDAYDLLHHCIEIALKKNPENIEAYITNMMKNEVSNEFSSFRRLYDSEIKPTRQTSTDILLRSEYDCYLDDLPVYYRAVWELVRQGYTHREISERTQGVLFSSPDGISKKHIEYIVKRVREYIKIKVNEME